MAPLRRYLRISKYSVLECRIYVDNPALVPSWLLHPRDPVLPRVIESVRPLVLPKLMEERERAKKKGAKKKGAIRDVLVEDDFEVSLFLTETNTRHSILYKHRRARDKTQTRLVSNSTRLTGGTSDAPIEIRESAGGAGGSGSGSDLRVELADDEQRDRDNSDDTIVLTAGAVGAGAPPNLLVEDSDEEGAVALQDIPAVQSPPARRSKRRRQDTVQIQDSGDEEEEEEKEEEDGEGEEDHEERAASDNDSLFVSENEAGDDGDQDADAPPSKRLRTAADEDDDASRKKKKLAMDVIYEGFAIYGRVLCLVVKRRGPPRGRGGTQTTLSASAASSRTAPSSASAEPAKPGGHASMENWIASTQMPAPQADLS